MDTLTINLMLSAFFACVLLAVNPFLAVAFCALVGGQMMVMTEANLYPTMVVFLIVGGGVTLINSYRGKHDNLGR